MARARTHKCAVSVCRAEIPTWLHFCKPHYAMLPAHIKEALHQEWLYMKRTGARHTDNQLELIRQGIAAVLEKLEKKAAKRGGARADLYQQGPAT